MTEQNNLKATYVFCIGAGPSQVEYFKILNEWGYRIIVTDQNPESPGFELSDFSFVASTHDLEANWQIIESQCKHLTITNVLSFASGNPQYVAAEISKRLGVDYTSPESVNTVIHKNKFRELLDILELQSVQHKSVATLEEALSAAEMIGLPLVIKPSFGGMGSQGVSIVRNASEIPKNYEKAQKASLNDSVLIEHFIEGKHLSFTGLIQNGEWRFWTVGTTIQSEKHNLITIGGAFGPSEVTETVQESVLSTMTSICNHLNLDNTTIRADIILSEGSGIPYLIELEIVLATPLILAPIAFGYNILKNILRVFLRLPAETARNILTGCAVRYKIHSSQNLGEIENLELIRKRDYVENINYNTSFNFLIDNKRYYILGYIITCANSQENAIRLAAQAENDLIIKL